MTPWLIKCIGCFSRGPGFNSHHRHGGSQAMCNSGSRRSSTLFQLLWVPNMSLAHRHTPWGSPQPFTEQLGFPFRCQLGNKWFCSKIHKCKINDIQVNSYFTTAHNVKVGASVLLCSVCDFNVLYYLMGAIF